jgi:hypothetical protein
MLSKRKSFSRRRQNGAQTCFQVGILEVEAGSNFGAT